MLFGIKGTIGSGKTTIANYLKNYGFIEYSMADPLKQIAIIFGFKFYQVYGSQEEKLEINEHWGISGREFLQKFGTEICREILPTVLPNMKFETTIWCKLFKIHYSKISKNNIIIPDIRFLDEANAIRELGGKIIELNRRIDKSGDEHSHRSELELDQIKPDIVINNNNTLEDLFVQVDRILGVPSDDRLLYNILFRSSKAFKNGETKYIHYFYDTPITFQTVQQVYKSLKEFPCKYTYFGNSRVEITGHFNQDNPDSSLSDEQREKWYHNFGSYIECKIISE